MASALIQLSSGRPTFVWREKAEPRRLQGKVPLPRGDVGVVPLSLGLCTLSALCAWRSGGAGADLENQAVPGLHPSRSHAGLSGDPPELTLLLQFFRVSSKHFGWAAMPGACVVTLSLRECQDGRAVELEGEASFLEPLPRPGMHHWRCKSDGT